MNRLRPATPATPAGDSSLDDSSDWDDNNGERLVKEEDRGVILLGPVDIILVKIDGS